jgi:NAD(P)-dependent dehydrogenase (short-subunit alcohol dehydrogenase family)
VIDVAQAAEPAVSQVANLQGRGAVRRSSCTRRRVRWLRLPTGNRRYSRQGCLRYEAGPTAADSEQNFMSEKKLSGRIAVITGASKGLGKSMALALGSAGAGLALVSRNKDQLNAVAEETKALGATAEIFVADVTDEAQVKRLEAAVIERFSHVDILINNAGINIRKSVTEFTLADWRAVLDTNLTGAFLMCRAFVPHMKGEGYGRVINLTSIMSHVALGGRSAYCASKAGLLGFTRALALELAPEKITVNGISPGPFATEMNTPIIQNPETNAQFISKIPIGRWGKVEEVGQLAAYLCSEEAGFITGTDILIDGGWTAQ